MEMIFKIKDVEYKGKLSFRTFDYFEQTTGVLVSDITPSINHTLRLFYSMLKANNKATFKLSYDDFYDVIEENEDLLNQFNQFLVESNEGVPTETDTKKKN